MINRVETAIQEGRCVLAVGGRALQNADVVAELRRRNVPSVVLGADPVNPAGPLSAESLAPVLDREGGVLVLVEPEAGTDGQALNELGGLLRKGSHRPKLFVASRAFNPFMLPMSMRLLKFEQIKQRAVDFVAALSVLPPAVVQVVEAAPARPAPAAKERERAPRPTFVGREEELATLKEMLASEGGPVVVAGPPGVGRRWLVEYALAQTELVRLPDFTIGRDSGADTFLARLAVATRLAGDDRLHQALRQGESRPHPAEVATLVADALQAEALAGQVMVIYGFDALLDRRDASLYREGRLELALRAILLSRPAMRVVFVAERAPTFYREGQAAGIRVLTLGGIKGRELYDLFQAWHAPDFPRDRFGPIAERTHGHPMSSRCMAADLREESDIDEVLEQPKFLKAAEVSDLAALARHLRRKVGELDKDLLGALTAAAILREPASIDTLQVLGVGRNERLKLLSLGLLEQTPFLDGRAFYVHPLVADNLRLRDVLDFDRAEMLGRWFIDEARKLKGPQAELRQLAMQQEGNRLLTEARRTRSCVRLPYPDNDPLIENVRGILRRRDPRLDIAKMRITEGVKSDPCNPELLLVAAEVKQAEKAAVADVMETYDLAVARAPTPEVFHAIASYHTARNARGKAAGALEQGIALFPDNGRMHRRLAGFYINQNRAADALAILEKARDLEPMMPDTYGLLGEVHMELGVDDWEKAIELLDEALRLAPENPVHLARMGELLRRTALVDQNNRDALLEQAEERLREAIKLEKGNQRVQVGLATILLDRGGDVEQAEWLLKQAVKRSETPEIFVQRARVLVRQSAFEEAERLLDRAAKKANNHHAIFAARAELWLAQGQVFHAFESLKNARERTARTAPERVFYERELQGLGALIESGQAADLMRAGASEQVEEVEGEGPRRDTAHGTILRKQKGEAAGRDVVQSADDVYEDLPPPADDEDEAEEAATDEDEGYRDGDDERFAGEEQEPVQDDGAGEE